MINFAGSLADGKMSPLPRNVTEILNKHGFLGEIIFVAYLVV